LSTSLGKSGVLSAEETALFCSQAAMVLRSGIPLVDGIGALCDDFRTTRSGPLFDRLHRALEDAGALYAALEAAPVLPPYAIRMIRVGEQAGKLDDVLCALADSYQREAQVRRNLKQAILYPTALSLLMAAVIAVVVFCVMPVFARVLRDLGAGLYATAEGVMNVGTVIGVAAMAIVGAILLVAAIAAVLLRTRFREKVLSVLRRLTPIFGRITRAMDAERFATAMTTLLASGYPIEDALPLVEGLSGGAEMRAKVVGVREAVARGVSFSEAVAQADIFDGLHARMLRAGASAGRVDSVLGKLAAIYRERFDRDISNAEALIEPILVALLAVIAGAILLSVMLPLAWLLSSMI